MVMKRIIPFQLFRAFHRKPLIKVYSHPRSGTHLIEKFLAENFYAGEELGLQSFTWGHWSNRVVDNEGNSYGKLFGSHSFPHNDMAREKPAIYIYRDGRAVCLSLWKTYNFMHADWKGISFTDYLRTSIDWKGSPGVKAEECHETVAEHWKRHVEAWSSIELPNLLLLRYEDVVQRPQYVANEVAARFSFLKVPKSVAPVNQPCGLLPNAAKIDAWSEYFSERDLDYFHSIVPYSHFALYEGGSVNQFPECNT
jgi:hypothetical protein